MNEEIKKQIRDKLSVCAGLLCVAATEADFNEVIDLIGEAMALLGEPLNWYEVTDGITRVTTDDWYTAIEAITDWHLSLSDDAPDKEFPEPMEIFKYVLQGPPDVERLNALIEAWEKELIDCYGYIRFPVHVKRISETDARSVPR